MRISVSDAKAQLTDLVRRAEAGEEVVLTRHGQPTVRLAPLRAVAGDMAARRVIIEAARVAAQAKIVAGATSARSQDWLYDGDGLPR
jgi:prevent-host-death family protein